jgi:hypothetical protein
LLASNPAIAGQARCQAFELAVQAGDLPKGEERLGVGRRGQFELGNEIAIVVALGDERGVRALADQLAGGADLPAVVAFDAPASQVLAVEEDRRFQRPQRRGRRRGGDGLELLDLDAAILHVRVAIDEVRDVLAIDLDVHLVADGDDVHGEPLAGGNERVLDRHGSHAVELKHPEAAGFVRVLGGTGNADRVAAEALVAHGRLAVGIAKRDPVIAVVVDAAFEAQMEVAIVVAQREDLVEVG